MDATTADAELTALDDLDALLGINESLLDSLFFFRSSRQSSSAASSSWPDSSAVNALEQTPGTVYSSGSPSAHPPENEISSRWRTAPSDWDQWQDWIEQDVEIGKAGFVEAATNTGGTKQQPGPAVADPLFDFSILWSDDSPAKQPLFAAPSTSLSISLPSTLPVDSSSLSPPLLETRLPSIAESPSDQVWGGRSDPSIVLQPLGSSPEEGSTAGRDDARKKRKHAGQDDGPEGFGPTRSKQQAHNIVEKRYRDRLTDMFAALQDAIPHLKKEKTRNQAGLATKTRVLAGATQYIRDLQACNEKLTEQKELLGKQVLALGKLNRELMMPGRSSGGGGAASKLMVGGLAGMLAMQGMHTEQQSNETTSGRGLFSIPVHLLTRLTQPFQHISASIGGSPSLSNGVALFKSFMLLLAALYIFLPAVFRALTRPPAAPKAAPAPLTSAGIRDIRRSAFITATRTIEIPENGLSLTATIAWASMRILLLNLGADLFRGFGWQLEGPQGSETKPADVAKRAWDIAIDAQLTGGDTKISSARLVLTLLASLALPATPYRLMLRSLHAQVVAARTAHRWAAYFLIKMSHRWWQRARLDHKATRDVAVALGAEATDTTLPAHLSVLLSLSADDAFSDEAVRRVAALAFPSTAQTGIPGSPDVDNLAPWLDTVAEDYRVLSPLDALAAWHAGIALRDTLFRTLEPESASDVGSDLTLAICTAPPYSATWATAFVVHALLLPGDNRPLSLARAFRALILSRPQGLWSAISDMSVAGEKQRQGDSHRLIWWPCLRIDLNVALRSAIAAAQTERDREEMACRALGAEIRGLTGDTADQKLGLLGLAALYRFLDDSFRQKKRAGGQKDLYEQVAGLLRVWSRREGEQTEGLGRLSQEAEENVASLSLNVLQWLVGIQEGQPVDDSEKTGPHGLAELGRPSEALAA
ncbi:hypothetical protein GQ53DRAFT_743496 [Thozetella sp. PMI_491]|nr:hypothetical protein GQ53DRAFT_743496 [Thozetella sp. PMI_491]